MPTPEQIKRFAADWGVCREAAGKKVDSVQLAGEVGKERLMIRFQDGTRLLAQAQPDGSLRAWMSCCGKPDGNPPEVHS